MHRGTPGDMRLPYRLQGQKVKSQGHGVNFGGHVAAELSSAVTYLFFDVYVLRDIFLVKFYSIIIV